MFIRACCAVVSLGLVLMASVAQAVVSVPSVIGDRMVLQAGAPLPVWGMAAPGETVTVTLGGKSVSGVADVSGRWRVTLPKQKAGGPLRMVVAGETNELQFEDVLVGEVWLGSGQSNMQWPVSKSANPAEEIAAAQYPRIRLFHVERTVATAPQDDCKGVWMECTPESVAEFSAVLYFFGRELHQALGQPLGLIHTSWGGTPAESWVSREGLESDADLKRIVETWDRNLAEYPAAFAAYQEELKAWEEAAEKAKAAGQEAPKRPTAPRGADNPWLASGLYNAMIHPLVPFAVKGAVWYQGESNAGRAYQYRKLFPAMIEDWRAAWGYPLSFHFVQLANFMLSLPEPGESQWAELREAQTMTLSLERTGMATIIDIGDALDIHPTNKQDVGKRLALNALARDYKKRVAYSGPVFKSMKVRGAEAQVRFDHVNGGLAVRGEALKGFAVAGEDKKFYWAEAKVVGKSVVLSAPEVAAPVAVRYAWADNPVCNLYNGAGLPAVPFRTDDWPGITLGKE